MELPLWLAMAGAMEANVERALAAGLTFRPLEETARGALEDAETTDVAGLTSTREAELLAAWHGRG
jgi:2'-hydroxyisoflavone reductase